LKVTLCIYSPMSLVFYEEEGLEWNFTLIVFHKV